MTVSEERYLLGRTTTANVKVRDGLLDVKLLRATEDGLERWEPVVKVGFPVAAAELTRVSDALDLTVSSDLPELISLDAMEAIIGRAGIRSVTVRKRRTRFTVEGCAAELTDLEVDGRSARSVAVESVDGRAVLRAVGAAGFGAHVNTSYPKGLAHVLGGHRPRAGAIDVGTNSVKFHVGERADEGWRQVVDRADVTRLGEGVADDGSIGAAALDRTAAAIATMADEAREVGVGAILAVGTAGLRAARNRAEALAAIRAASGLDVGVVDGEEEARLAYLGARSGLALPEGALAVVDTGGGSTQFTLGTDASVTDRWSVPIGAVRITERFGLAGAVDAAVVREALDAIAAELAPTLEGHATPEALVAMGGAVTNLVAVRLGLDPYDPDRVQGATLELDEIDRQIQAFRVLDADGRRRLPGLQPGRAEVILAGACIVRSVLAALGRRSLTVSDRGLRHGLLLDRFGP